MPQERDVRPGTADTLDRSTTLPNEARRASVNRGNSTAHHCFAIQSARSRPPTPPPLAPRVGPPLALVRDRFLARTVPEHSLRIRRWMNRRSGCRHLEVEFLRLGGLADFGVRLFDFPGQG